MILDIGLFIREYCFYFEFNWLFIVDLGSIFFIIFSCYYFIGIVYDELEKFINSLDFDFFYVKVDVLSM